MKQKMYLIKFRAMVTLVDNTQVSASCDQEYKFLKSRTTNPTLIVSE